MYTESVFQGPLGPTGFFRKSAPPQTSALGALIRVDFPNERPGALIRIKHFLVTMRQSRQLLLVILLKYNALRQNNGRFWIFSCRKSKIMVKHLFFDSYYRRFGCKRSENGVFFCTCCTTFRKSAPGRSLGFDLGSAKVPKPN
jgi:hypothetical protein